MTHRTGYYKDYYWKNHDRCLKHLREYNIRHNEERRAYKKRYRETHKEENKAYMKKWRSEHHGYILDYKRIYEHNTKTMQKQKKKHDYYLKNSDKIKQRSKQWENTHRERIRHRIALKMLTDGNFRTACRLRHRLLKALKNYGTGKKFKSEFYGVDFKAIIERLGNMPQDGRKYHIDHIRPLSSFDLRDAAQVKLAFAPENHQWLEAKENLSKGSKWNGGN